MIAGVTGAGVETGDTGAVVGTDTEDIEVEVGAEVEIWVTATGRMTVAGTGGQGTGAGEMELSTSPLAQVGQRQRGKRNEGNVVPPLIWPKGDVWKPGGRRWEEGRRSRHL